jgi:ABC-type oligopeptide transport system ATPase subunit
MNQQIVELEYTKDYIKRALISEYLEAPDNSKANGTGEALYGLFIAHQSGGIAGARMAWATLKRMRPELSDYDKGPLLIHADELRFLSTPTYLLTSYPIYSKAFNVLVGKSGSGKSFVALDVAGRVATDSTCIYIAGEGLAGYAARWEAWKKYHEVVSAELYFYREALQVLNEIELMQFIGILEQHKPSLVIIDTMARSAVGMDENSARDVGQFVAAVDRLRMALDCAVLVVHHTGKSGDMRGSTALYGASDTVIVQSLNDGVMKLTNNPDFGGKNKYGQSDFEAFFRIMSFAANGFEGAVLVESEKIISTPSANTLTNYQRKILEAVEGYEEGIPAKVVIDATGISQSTIYSNLKKLMKANYVLYQNERYTITTEGTEALLGGE